MSFDPVGRAATSAEESCFACRVLRAYYKSKDERIVDNDFTIYSSIWANTDITGLLRAVKLGFLAGGTSKKANR